MYNPTTEWVYVWEPIILGQHGVMGEVMKCVIHLALLKCLKQQWPKYRSNKDFGEKV